MAQTHLRGPWIILLPSPISQHIQRALEGISLGPKVRRNLNSQPECLPHAGHLCMYEMGDQWD